MGCSSKVRVITNFARSNGMAMSEIQGKLSDILSVKFIIVGG